MSRRKKAKGIREWRERASRAYGGFRKRARSWKGTFSSILQQIHIGIVGLILVFLAVITALTLLSLNRGRLIEGWLRLLRLGFGWGAYLMPLALGVLGGWLIIRNLRAQGGLDWGRVAGGGLTFLVLLALLHLLYPTSEPKELALVGRGGGYLGFLVSETLRKNIGFWGAYIVLVAGGIGGIILLLELSLAALHKFLVEGWRALLKLSRPKACRPQPPPLRPERQPSRPIRARPSEPRPTRPAPSLREEAAQATLPKPSRLDEERRWDLPRIDEMLEESQEEVLSEAEIRLRASIIEEALENFGVPAKVVEVNRGPAVTQFGVEPGYIERRDHRGRIRKIKVKVSQISGLANDLALALSAAPIRIEAPVPGRPYVGIEVPNPRISLVALRSVMETPAYRDMDSPLKAALGRDVSGGPVVTDLAAMPHLLIGGATGSGKSICIKCMVTSLLFNNTPDDLRLVMIDPKMVELAGFNGIPHLQMPVVTDMGQVLGVLRWVARQMDKRYKILSQAKVRDIESYNRSRPAEERLRHLIVVVDELADLMMLGPYEVEQTICRLAQMARATGIHLVLATQRPSVDVVTGLIKANFPARISFAVVSQVDSRVILDTGGAEQLLGRGDMLYMPPDSSKLVRLQGSYVSDEEIGRLVNFWKRSAATRPFPVQVPLSWERISTETADKAEDDLLEEAIEVARQHRRVSTSLLQRRLRIGYPRAARLIDLMEERGIIGPSKGGGQSREVLIGEEGEGDSGAPEELS